MEGRGEDGGEQGPLITLLPAGGVKAIGEGAILGGWGGIVGGGCGVNIECCCW